MGLFDFLLKKKDNNSYATPANPLHDAIFVARCQKFDSEEVVPGRVLMLGDSITAGAENFPNLFPGIINQGIPGDTTVDIRKRLHLVTKQQPNKIFLLIGTNNLGSWVSTDTSCQRNYPVVTNKLVADYLEILNFFKAQIPNTKIFVQSILPINGVMPGSVTTGRTNIVVQQLNEVLSHVNMLHPYFQYLDLYPHFLDETGLVLNSKYTNDGLHPNEEGYKVWSAILSEYI